jgi:RNA polymerase sigma factor (sigma-70 family)
MRGSGRVGPDTGTVIAARGGDQEALDALVAHSLPLVYNIVGRALNGHPDVDDVVQETLLRVLRGLHELRSPEAFRSWLVAIAVRQVRDFEQARRTARIRNAALDVVREVPDPASDFAAVTILRLGLTDQRREVVEATRWLDNDDQALLALWWLEETGDLDRAELAGALGLSGRHTAVRVQRMKEQMERARTIVRALAADPGCPDLQRIIQGWDGVPSPLWRKRLARHVRDECRVCGRVGSDLLPVGGLLAGLPLLPVPPGVGLAGGGAAHAPLVQHTSPSDQGAAGRMGGRRAAKRSRAAHGRQARGLFSGSRRLLVPFSATAAVAGIAAAALLVGQLSGSGSSRTADAAARPSSAVGAARGIAAPPAGPGASPSTRPSASPTGSPRASTKPSTKAHRSASPGTRSAAPTRRAATQPAPPPAKPVTSSKKKGISVWSFNGVNTALAQSGASWYYTWSTQHQGISAPAGTGFVPMIWGADSVTTDALAQAKAAGPYLLGFNEPDMGAQSNMTVDQALGLWPKLMATGSTLGSPAVAYGGADAGGWLDRFMSGAAQRGYRVDFITLHWYGSDFVSARAVDQLKSYLQAVYNRYHKPVWLTEYALIDFSHGTAFPTDAQQAAFVTDSTRMLGSLSFVQRYAWFALPASDTAPSTGLFRSGPVATAAGRAYQAAG